MLAGHGSAGGCKAAERLLQQQRRPLASGSRGQHEADTATTAMLAVDCPSGRHQGSRWPGCSALALLRDSQMGPGRGYSFDSGCSNRKGNMTSRTFSAAEAEAAISAVSGQLHGASSPAASIPCSFHFAADVLTKLLVPCSTT